MCVYFFIDTRHHFNTKSGLYNLSIRTTQTNAIHLKIAIEVDANYELWRSFSQCAPCFQSIDDHDHA